MTNSIWNKYFKSMKIIIFIYKYFNNKKQFIMNINKMQFY